MSSIRDFVPLQKLGEGTYSNVYKVRRLSDQQIYALKKVKLNSLNQKEKQNALNEVRVLASIDCPYIIGYKEAFFDQKLSVLCIVMDYANSGDLHKLIQQQKRANSFFPQRQIWKLAGQILIALSTLHSKGILHRDLKCANIFKHSSDFKLGDLNVSKVNGNKLAYTQTGTPYYASPEVWRDEPYDSKSDIWSFGCIIYETAALKPPFQGRDMDDLYHNVQKNKYVPIPSRYSPELCQLINLCLQKKAALRPSAKELLEMPMIKEATQQNHIYPREKQKPKEEQGLLQTITLPDDLRSLKKCLPQSKYEDSKKSKEEIKFSNKSALMAENRKPTLPIYSGNHKLNRYMSPRCKQLELGAQYKKSPQNKYIALSCLMQSPVSLLKLQPHKEVSSRCLQRNYNSDHKKSNRDKPSVLDKYIRESLSKRPPSSIPRTEKTSAVSQRPIGYEQYGLDEWRRKLVKKNRILSSNSKPSWWN